MDIVLIIIISDDDKDEHDKDTECDNGDQFLQLKHWKKVKLN